MHQGEKRMPDVDVREHGDTWRFISNIFKLCRSSRHGSRFATCDHTHDCLKLGEDEDVVVRGASIVTELRRTHRPIAPLETYSPVTIGGFVPVKVFLCRPIAFP